MMTAFPFATLECTGTEILATPNGIATVSFANIIFCPVYFSRLNFMQGNNFGEITVITPPVSTPRLLSFLRHIPFQILVWMCLIANRVVGILFVC